MRAIWEFMRNVPVDIRKRLGRNPVACARFWGSRLYLLVAAQYLNSSKRFNGGQFLDNSALLCKERRTDSHCGSDDGWETDWYADDRDGERKSQDLSSGV